MFFFLYLGGRGLRCCKGDGKEGKIRRERNNKKSGRARRRKWDGSK